jgi:hypothetical protein
LSAKPWVVVSELLLVATAAIATDVRAEGAAPAEEPRAPLVDVHAFVSQGYIQSTDNQYLAKSKRGSFEFTEVGVTLTRAISDKLRVGVQLFTRDLGPIGNYRARFDWFDLDYRFADWFGVRAGRTKLPFGLYNETSDIDAARIPVLLPQSVYPTASRDYLLAQTGVEVYGYVRLGADGGALDYRLFGGTLYLDTGDSSAPRITRLEVPYLAGARLMWVTPLPGLQLGGSAQMLRFDGDYTPSGPDDPAVAAYAQRGLLPAGYTSPIGLKIPVVLWLASVEYGVGDLTFASEYGRWWSDGDFQTTAGKSSAAATRSDRFYVMGSYRCAPWLVPGLYYSMLYPNIEQRHGREHYQHDVALSLRFDLTQNWLVKAEAHYMIGTAGLDATLNGVASLSGLEKDWGVLLLKTTAYF